MYDPTLTHSQESLLTRQRGMRRQQKQVMAAGDMEEKLSNFLQIFEHSGAFKSRSLVEREQGNQFTKAFKVPLKQNRTVSLKVGNRLR